MAAVSTSLGRLHLLLLANNTTLTRSLVPPPSHLNFSPDGRFLIAGFNDAVRVFTPELDDIFFGQLPDSEVVDTVFAGKEDRTLVTACRDGTILLVDEYSSVEPRAAQLNIHEAIAAISVESPTVIRVVGATHIVRFNLEELTVLETAEIMTDASSDEGLVTGAFSRGEDSGALVTDGICLRWLAFLPDGPKQVLDCDIGAVAPDCDFVVSIASGPSDGVVTVMAHVQHPEPANVEGEDGEPAAADAPIPQTDTFSVFSLPVTSSLTALPQPPTDRVSVIIPGEEAAGPLWLSRSVAPFVAVGSSRRFLVTAADFKAEEEETEGESPLADQQTEDRADDDNISSRPTTAAGTTTSHNHSAVSINDVSAIAPLEEEDTRIVRPPIVEEGKWSVEDDLLAAFRKARSTASPSADDESKPDDGDVGTGAARHIPVDVALDSADLMDRRDDMEIYVFTRLVGDGGAKDVVRYVPMQLRSRASTITQNLERIFDRRLLVSFLTTGGKLVELRPSTMRIFESLEDDDKQLYCRSLFPSVSKQQSNSMPPRATTPGSMRTLADLTSPTQASMHRAQTPGGHSNMTGTSVLSSQSRISVAEESRMVSRLYGDVHVSKLKNRLKLEEKHCPTEKNPKTIGATESSELLDRLTKDSSKKKRTVERHRKKIEEEAGRPESRKLDRYEEQQYIQKFYNEAISRENKKQKRLEGKLQQRVECKKIANKDGWDEWQKLMARPIKQNLRLKDQYY